ncbi:sensor histidine kinase [Dactylosporangium sp. NPDC050688]|uniref:sensor histidine kinase n=1 Tax=Dactylosporangium sp. NPDC050688 TaxID=3157217 RepID=UPI0033DA5808
MRLASIRGFPRTHPLVVDTAIAVTLAAAGCLAGHQYHPEDSVGFDLLAYVLTCVISLPLALRRRFPVAVLLVSNAAFIWYIAAGYQPSLNFWSPVIALFFVSASRTGSAVVLGWVVTGAAVLHNGVVAELPLPLAVIQALIAPLAAVLVGTQTRRLAERNAMLAAMTARLHVEQKERARQAVVEERVRIARELHDVIAHHMSVISIQSGLARYVLTSDPDTAHAALNTVSDTSREALAEMRRMLALLRIDPDEPSRPDDPGLSTIRPAPGLGRLEVLADRVRAAGVPVDVVVAGRQRPLAPGADLCAYRVIQEGLTNVLAHAAPARATISLTYGESELTVRITDDGRRARPPQQAPRERVGLGLSGMRERAWLYGGTLTAGHRAEGGFEVVLTLPTTTLVSETTTAPGGVAA